MKNPVTLVKSTPENPYMNARKEWNERYADIIKASHQWRLAAIIGNSAALVLAAGFVFVALQHRVIPYAVEFNEHSEVVRVTRADAMSHPSTNQIKAALRNWIIGARTVFVDRRAQQGLIDTTYAMVAPDSSAFQTVSSFHKENNPYDRSQKETVEVTVNGIMQISDDTWRIEWTETTKQLSGRVIDSKAWQGAFTIVISPPKDEGQILINPTGVHIKNFSWTTRL